MIKVLVIAPHPDDETLGCGGTLLRHQAQGDEIHWLIFTDITQNGEFSEDRVLSRQDEIKQVNDMYKFSSLHNLKQLTTRLDTVPVGDLVHKVSKVFNLIQPDIVYLPYPGDVHTDHRIVFDSVVACTKWFRFNFIKRVLVYETLSETDFVINPDVNGFRPNVFVNISDYLETKIKIAEIYRNEIGVFPFPRSGQAICALAHLRGAAAGCQAAESFMLLKEII